MLVALDQWWANFSDKGPQTNFFYQTKGQTRVLKETYASHYRTQYWFIHNHKVEIQLKRFGRLDLARGP